MATDNEQKFLGWDGTEQLVATVKNLLDGKQDKGDAGGAAIIDVTELPTENIDENAFYRLTTGSLIINQVIFNTNTVYCIETLPETGTPASNIDCSEFTVYYNTADGVVYGYVDSALLVEFGVSVGWHEFGELMRAFGEEYGGVITAITDDPSDGVYRLLLDRIIYSHKDGVWTFQKTIGWAGAGQNAEVFNHPSNEASGFASHVEGYYTVANSHAQHVQGEYNIPDVDTDNVRGKYAHIVGNGTSQSARSNAHTLDWNGLGWFAGGLKVGGTGQDDVNAKEIATKEYVDNAIQSYVDEAILGGAW